MTPRRTVAAASRSIVVLLLLAATGALAAAAGHAAATPTTAPLDEFEVALPIELRTIAGHGTASPVTRAKVTIGVPDPLTVTRETPVLVISATADRGFRSSRLLLRAYADAALASGWIIVAADAADAANDLDDDVALRLALDLAALSVLAQRWPATAASPLAFGGFSGGAKIAGWLAAAFAAQGRSIVGVYQAGINEDTLVAAATQFDVLHTAFAQVPVFLQVGRDDEVATPPAHREVAARLKRAGFVNVRLVSFRGEHEVDAAPLRDALAWFREVAARASDRR